MASNLKAMSEQSFGPSNRGGNLLFYKLFSKGPETPDKGKWVSKFYLMQKTDAGWRADVQNGFDCFELIIKGIEHRTFDSEQYGLKHSVRLIGSTSDQDVSIDMQFSAQTYGILNALCNKEIDRSKPLRIEVWTTASKEKKDTYYANAKVSDLTGGKYEWAYPIANLPKGVSVQVGGKTVYDDTPVVEHWIKGIAYLKNQYAAVHGEKPAPTPPAPSQAQRQPQQQPSQQQSAMKPNPAFQVAPEMQNGPGPDFFADGQDSEDLPF